MPSCDYCTETFADEESYLDHLADAHGDELGRIDRRRVDQHRNDDPEGLSVRSTAAIVGLLLAVVLVAGAVVAFTGGGNDGQASQEQSAPTPHDLWDVHYHGTMEMVVNGQEVDFSQQKYQVQADAFHFEGDNGTRWHGHARGVTLERAMATLDIGVTDDSVTYQGTTYTDGENANVIVTVDGNDVNPRTYTLEEGDHIRIVVESN